MKQTFIDVLTYLAAAAARALTPAVQRKMIQLFLALAMDLPKLSGPWVIEFNELAPDGSVRLTAIDAELLQFGRYVRGRGHLQGEPGDPFEYQALIKRNVLYGSFRRSKGNMLAGTGTFVLKISADSRRLLGHCTWYDNLLDDVWSSSYTWTKN